MKNSLLILSLFVVFSASCISIPKKAVGQYDTTVPAFEFEEKGETRQASGFELSVLLRESYLLYRAGSLEFKGNYTKVEDNGQNVDIKVNLFNSSSITFDLDLVWNKKTSALAIHGIKGLEEVICEKKIEKEEKNRGFKRL